MMTCKMCQNYHEACRFVCKSWCESTQFYTKGDDVVCGRFVAHDEMRAAHL